MKFSAVLENLKAGGEPRTSQWFQVESCAAWALLGTCRLTGGLQSRDIGIVRVDMPRQPVERQEETDEDADGGLESYKEQLFIRRLHNYYVFLAQIFAQF